MTDRTVLYPGDSRSDFFHDPVSSSFVEEEAFLLNVYVYTEADEAPRRWFEQLPQTVKKVDHPDGLTPTQMSARLFVALSELKKGNLRLVDNITPRQVLMPTLSNY